MAADWTGGYPADIGYAPGYYHEQAPAALAFVCLLNGLAPPDLDAGFTYGELGCGLGVTLAVLAAANPAGRFSGFDFNPAHIGEARRMAAAAGLANVDFREADFAGLAAGGLADLPDFDIIALHGVYSWIAAADRGHIVEILRRKLKPGGIAYVSYNAEPGWTGGGPVQWLLERVGATLSGRSDERFAAALAFLTRMREQRTPVLAESRFLDSILALERAGRRRYLTHEYMNANWRPLYHAEVAAELAAAKLAYAGSALVLDNFPDLNLTKERQELLAGIGDRALKETVRDFFVPRLLRKDVFVRGARRLGRHAHAAATCRLRLALTRPRSAVSLALDLPIGEAAADAAAFAPVLDALAVEPRSIGELVPDAARRPAKGLEVAGILVGSGQAAIALGDVDDRARRAAARLNRVLAAIAEDAPIGDGHALAAATIGGGLPVTGLEMWVYRRHAAGEAPDAGAIADAILAAAEERGETLWHDGQPVSDAARLHHLLRTDLQKIIAEKLPVWSQLGIG